MAAFQYSLEHAAQIAAKRIPVQRKLAVAFLDLIRYKSTVLQWLASSPWKSIKASIYYAYYKLAYRFFYQYAGFYWLSLAWYQPFYTFCLALSLA